MRSADLNPCRGQGHSSKPMFCYRCGFDLNFPDWFPVSVWINDVQTTWWSPRNRAYTFYFGKLTCISCFHILDSAVEVLP